jgi:hypothetical protein
VKFSVLAMAIAGLAAISTSASATNLVTDGSFEAGSAWTLSGTVGVANHVDYTNLCCNAFGMYPFGTNVLSFGAGNLPAGVGDGVVYQDIMGTVAGQTYTLSYWFGAIAGNNEQTLKAEALDGATSLASFTGTDDSPSLDFATVLQNVSITFTAMSGTTRIQFSDMSATSVNTDLLLDNVSVTAVPEPGSYALLLAGLAAVGFVARRKSVR